MKGIATPTHIRAFVTTKKVGSTLKIFWKRTQSGVWPTKPSHLYSPQSFTARKYNSLLVTTDFPHHKYQSVQELSFSALGEFKRIGQRGDWSGIELSGGLGKLVESQYLSLVLWGAKEVVRYSPSQSFLLKRDDWKRGAMKQYILIDFRTSSPPTHKGNFVHIWKAFQSHALQRTYRSFILLFRGLFHLLLVCLRFSPFSMSEIRRQMPNVQGTGDKGAHARTMS